MAEQSYADFIAAHSEKPVTDGPKDPTDIFLPPLAQAPIPAPAPALPPAMTPTAPLSIAMPPDPVEFDKAAGLPTAHEQWYEDPVMAARAFLDGQLFGFSDEIGASIAATAASMTSSESWDDIYGGMMKSLENDRRLFTTNHIGASLGLGIAGGFASPFNKPIGYIASKAEAAIATGADKLGTITGLWMPRVQRALLRMETQAPNTMKAPPTRMEAYVRGVQENLPAAVVGGAIYGAGATEQGGSRVAGAMTGAALSAVATPVMQALPTVIKALAAPRVAQSVTTQEGENIPLTLAAGANNPTIGWLYRNVLARSFIAKDMLSTQAARWLTPLYSRIDLFESRLADAKKLTAKLREATTARAKEALASARQTLRDASAGRVRQLRKDFRARKEVIKRQAAEAEVAATQFPAVFRSQAMHRAIPDDFPAEVKAGIQDAMEMGDYLAANMRMRDAWNKYGFHMLNSGIFQIGQPRTKQVTSAAPQSLGALLEGRQPLTKEVSEVSFDGIAAKVAAAVNKEDLISLTTPGNKIDFVKGEVVNFLKEVADERGRVKGSSLATLRNMISGLMKGSAIAGDTAARGNEPAMRAIYMELKNTLDSMIKAQLTPAQAQAFEAHQQAYKVRLAMDQAITDAARKEQGAFTPDGWLASLNSLFRKDMGVGKAPLQKEAFDAQQSVQNAETAIKNLADETHALVTEETVKAMDDMESALVREKASLTSQINKLRSPEKTVTAEMGKAASTGAVTLESALKASEQKLADLQKTRKTLLAILPHKGDSGAVTSGEAGQAARLIQSLTMNVLPYVFGFTLIPATASKPWFQKTIAGQTWLQKAVDDALTPKLTEHMVRSTAISGGGLAISDPLTVQAITGADKAERSAAFRAMKSSGSLERLRKTKPELARMLEEANARY